MTDSANEEQANTLVLLLEVARTLVDKSYQENAAVTAEVTNALDTALAAAHRWKFDQIVSGQDAQTNER